MHGYAEIVNGYQAYGLTAFVITVFATPIAMRVASHYGVMDVPDQKLKPHAKPIPYLGGAAICLAWATAIIVAVIRGDVQTSVTLPIMIGGVAIAGLGLIDDIREVPPKLRLLLGAAIIAIVLIKTRTGLQMADSVLKPLGIQAPVWLTQTASLLIGIVLVLGAVNSTNLIDGLDGLCSGVTAIISLGFFLLAAHLAIWAPEPLGNRLVLTIAMLGAALGFLPYNFNPARIFMGDAGSVLLGYNCGILILLFAEPSTIRWMLGALMIFALPVFDTSLAMFRRWRSGRSAFEGDRSHFYDQLVQRGLSVRQTVIVCYVLALFFAAAGLLMIWEGADGPVVRLRYAIPLYALIGVVIAGVAWRTGLTHPEEPAQIADGPHDN